jgi:hypothetical protein
MILIEAPEELTRIIDAPASNIRTDNGAGSELIGRAEHLQRIGNFRKDL